MFFEYLSILFLSKMYIKNVEASIHRVTSVYQTAPDNSSWATSDNPNAILGVLGMYIYTLLYYMHEVKIMKTKKAIKRIRTNVTLPPILYQKVKDYDLNLSAFLQIKLVEYFTYIEGSVHNHK